MDKKKTIQVVLTVIAISVCGVIYLVAGPGQKGDVKADEFVAGDSLPGAVADSGGGKVNVSATSSSAVMDATEVYVYICGEVKHPGVYTFSKEPRVVEVVKKAGGFTKKADQTSVNLALIVQDGSQVVIGKKGSSSGTGSISGEGSGGVSQSSSDDNKIDINTAGAEQLMTIPGIGEAKATAIITYRQEHGRFNKPEDIMQIPGIKEGIYNRIKDSIKV